MMVILAFVGCTIVLLFFAVAVPVVNGVVHSPGRVQGRSDIDIVKVIIVIFART